MTRALRAAVEALRDEWNRRYDANEHMTGCPPGAGYYDLLALEIDDVLRDLGGREGPNERDCHPYDEVCREGAPCRNHGGIVGPNERDEITALGTFLAGLVDGAVDELAAEILASDWLAERDRRTAATAVREAAKWIGDDWARAELLDRADRIERGE